MEPEPIYKNKQRIIAISIVAAILIGTTYYFVWIKNIGGFRKSGVPAVLIPVAAESTTAKLTGTEAEAFLKTMPEEVQQALLPQEAQ